MKQKGIITLGIIGLIGVLGVTYYFKRKKKSVVTITKDPPYRVSTPTELFGDIVKTLVISESYKNEEDLFYKVIKEFGKYCKSYEWYSEIPATCGEFLEKLKELGLYDMFVVIIEEKYKTRN